MGIYGDRLAQLDTIFMANEGPVGGIYRQVIVAPAEVDTPTAITKAMGEVTQDPDVVGQEYVDAAVGQLNTLAEQKAMGDANEIDFFRNQIAHLFTKEKQAIERGERVKRMKDIIANIALVPTLAVLGHVLIGFNPIFGAMIVSGLEISRAGAKRLLQGRSTRSTDQFAQTIKTFRDAILTS